MKLRRNVKMFSIICIGLLIAPVYWLYQSQQLNQSTMAPANPIPHSDKSINQLLDEDEPIPGNSLLPAISKLTAPIQDLDDPQTAELQLEAEQLIEEMDQLLQSEDPSIAALSDAELQEIYQHPDFQIGLEQQADLEKRLESLP